MYINIINIIYTHRVTKKRPPCIFNKSVNYQSTVGLMISGELNPEKNA